jgi:glutamate--cysteine ligase
VRLAKQRLEQLISEAGPESLSAGLRGLEKECLRVTPEGKIAQTLHPRMLGSALTHPSITTDYSEALLEFITPPMQSSTAAWARLDELHRFAHRALDKELLWPMSMPCTVEGDPSVPIAWYGTSNFGTLKHVYRRGLGHRYGRVMQAIAGVHFNYSLPESFWLAQAMPGQDAQPLQALKSDGYFRLIRNFQRHGWLITYLFGASPAVDKSFFGKAREDFAALDERTLYLPYATSLRMSDIGYKNRAQTKFDVAYDGLKSYLASLSHALEAPDPEYAAIGVVADGEYRQLSTNLLQLEAEYYSFVRPKSVPHGKETLSLSLRRRGVEYVEVRTLDLNPFEPAGVALEQMRFVEPFLILCMLLDSPPVSLDEQRQIDHNQTLVAREGRRPGLELVDAGKPRRLSEWGSALCQALLPICQVLDQTDAAAPYRQAVEVQLAVLGEPGATPSAQVLRQMRERKESFIEFALRLAHQHRAHYLAQALASEKRRELDQLAQASLAEQVQIEASDQIPFEQYRQHYLAQR